MNYHGYTESQQILGNFAQPQSLQHGGKQANQRIEQKKSQPSHRDTEDQNTTLTDDLSDYSSSVHDPTV